MPASNRTDLARNVFTAFAAADRETIEALFAPLWARRVLVLIAAFR
jgi:hypothetical protein